MRSVLTINANALAHNLKQIKQKNPDVKVLAYLKQNAYSMSDELISSVLCQADGFGVTDFNAAVKLRSMYADKVIVDASLPPTKKYLEMASKQDITVIVYSLEMIDLIQQYKIKGNYWLKINTGFNRLGIQHEHMAESIKILEKFSNSQLVLMTHFMDSDIHSEVFQAQMNLWQSLIKPYNLPTSHSRSCTILQQVSPMGDWVRPGLMLYGMMTAPGWDLRLALELKAPIYQIRDIKAGEYVGYDHAYQFKKNTRIAITAIGYGDGFPLKLADESRLAIHGKLVPIVGKVSMDFIAIDIGDIDANVGDYVEIIGPNAKALDGFEFAHHALITKLKHRRLDIELRHHV